VDANPSSSLYRDTHSPLKTLRTEIIGHMSSLSSLLEEELLPNSKLLKGTFGATVEGRDDMTEVVNPPYA
jgi:hypothetical protein